jgi:hypothetical protein
MQQSPIATILKLQDSESDSDKDAGAGRKVQIFGGDFHGRERVIIFSQETKPPRVSS